MREVMIQVGLNIESVLFIAFFMIRNKISLKGNIGKTVLATVVLTFCNWWLPQFTDIFIVKLLMLIISFTSVLFVIYRSRVVESLQCVLSTFCIIISLEVPVVIYKMIFEGINFVNEDSFIRLVYSIPIRLMGLVLVIYFSKGGHNMKKFKWLWANIKMK